MRDRSQVDNDIIIIMLIPVLTVIMLGYMLILFCIAKKKSKLVGPVTQHPIIPFPQKELQEFKGTRKMKNVIPEVRIQCETTENNFFRYRSIEKVNTYMLSLFNLTAILEDEFEQVRGKNYYQKKPKISVPTNARTISIKMDNFKHGSKCHEFEPIDGISPGSYYTYQMFGDNRIQVTNYVENGVSYVAGFCIYIHNPKDWGTHYPTEVLKKCLLSRKYAGNQQNFKTKEMSESEKCVDKSPQNETAWNFCPEVHDALMKKTKWIRRYKEAKWGFCFKSKGENWSVVKSGKVYHEVWHSILDVVWHRECKECTEELSLEEEEQPPVYSSLFVV